MLLIYNLGIELYSLVIRILVPFNLKAKQILVGRNESIKRVQSGVIPQNAIWIHCASLGEFEQGRPVIELIKSSYPSEKIVLTFFSPSGYEIRKNYSGVDAVLYLPSDTARGAKRFVNLLNPKVAIFVKYEFWHHYYKQLDKNNVPIYSISSIFRVNQIFFKGYGKWFRAILEKVDHFFCQDAHSVELLNSIGITNCSIAGDTRFDRVFEIAKSVKPINGIEKFINGKQVIIAGSTWLPDEELLIEYVEKFPNIKLIIAPHEIHKAHIEKIKELVFVKYSLYTEQKVDEWIDSQVLIVDTIGLLSSLYQYGTVAYVGGGFGKGIHNTLEAATFGLPIIFGPNYLKFKEARDLIQLKSAFSIKNYNEIQEIFDNLLLDQSNLEKSSLSAKNYVKLQVGATSKIVNSIMSSK